MKTENKSTEKKLTEKEQKRLEVFEEKSSQLESQGYKKSLLLLSPLSANLGSLLITLPIVVVFVAGCILFNKGIKLPENLRAFSLYYFITIILSFVGIVIHELIHGLFWAIQNPIHGKAISFGFNKKLFAPYCTCSEPLTKSAYIIGALMPVTILGFIPGIISIFSGNIFIMIFSVLMILGGGGDLLIILKLLRFKTDSKDILYYDHPTECGTAVFCK